MPKAKGAAKQKRSGETTETTVKDVIAKLNSIVELKPSALAGFSLLAGCTAALLDMYAMPNEGNPQGMCDNPADFRQWFCDQLTTTPVLEKKA